jgi:hypothetical protein
MIQNILQTKCKAIVVLCSTSCALIHSFTQKKVPVQSIIERNMEGMFYIIMYCRYSRYIYRITGNFCGQLRTAEIKIAEYHVK